MAEQWYYLQDGQPRGPVLREKLGRLAAAGQIDGASLVWRDGMPDWLPAASLGLVVSRSVPPPPPAFPPPPVVPPPPPVSAKPASSFANSAPAAIPPASIPTEPRRSYTIPPALSRRPAARRSRTPLIVGVAMLTVIVAGATGWIAHAIFDSQQARSTATSGRSVARKDSRASETNLPDVTLPKTKVPPTVARRDDFTSDRTSSPKPPRPPRILDSDAVADSPLPKVDSPEPTPTTTSAPAKTPNPAVVSRDPDTSPPTSKPTEPTPSLQPAIGSRTAAKVLFQEIDIERTPQFSVLGAVMAQDLKYQILSELNVGETNEQGIRIVEQTIKDTRLVRSDEMSRASFADSLRKLKGWQFTFKVNRVGDVTNLVAGPKDGRKAVAVEPKGGKGFLVTSVMDADGWKEMAELSFFVPPDQTGGNVPWTRQRTHDYGALGSWYGETRYQRAGTKNGLLQVDFVHHLAYAPPKKDAGDLPFAIKDAVFKPETAGGVIQFDSQAGRIRTAQERFVVKGTINTELLGEASTIELEETQAITIRIFDQNPWRQ